MSEWHSVIYMNHNLFIHSSDDGHLARFHVLAVVNNVAMNIGVHVSFSVLFSSVTCKGLERWRSGQIHLYPCAESGNPQQQVSLTWESVSHIEMKSGETKFSNHHEDRSINYSLRDGNGQGEGDSHLSWNVEIERPYIRGSGLFSATFAELFSASILHIACPLTLRGPGVFQRTCPWVCLQTSEFLVKSLCISFPP